MGMRKKVTKAEYLEFFRQVLAGLEDDFPNRFLDEVRLQGPLAAGRLQILDAEQVAFSLKSFGRTVRIRLSCRQTSCWRNWRRWCRHRA